VRTALAFLWRPDPPEYGRRFSRLRWRRAIPAEETREVSGAASAAEAFAGAQIWVVVRDESALPWLPARFPVPEPGRTLVAGAVVPGPEAAHTLREWEVAGRPPEGAAGSDATGVAALAFRTADFPPLPGETVCGFIDRLIGAAGAPERDPAFRAFVFEDSSGRERPELTRHIQVQARRLLDVGCGAGGASAGLKSRVGDLRVVGIESNPAAAGRARDRLDEVLVGDAPRVLEDLAREGRTFDAFLFADVLEHLEDPVRALSSARALAEPGATLVASVPNAGHLSLVRDLVLGRFDPVPAGLSDAGHLRWFTKGSLADALEEAGWRVICLESWPGAAASESEGFLAGLEPWPGLDSESLRTYQWFAVARPASVRVGNSQDVSRKSPNRDLLLFSLDSPLFDQLRFGAVNRFRGMVLDGQGKIVRGLRVSIDGEAAGEFPTDRPSEDLPRHLPRLPAAGHCRFDFEALVPTQGDAVDFEAVWQDGGAEHLLRLDLGEIRASSTRLQAMRRALARLASPSADIVFLTQGHRDVAAYQGSIVPGLVNAKRYVAAAGVDADRCARVLDFGCGSGRILTGWHLDGRERDLFGCDTNPRLIDWASENLPASLHFDHTPALPPLPYPDGRFDLACAISVFTHLRFPSQELWARELARVLAPGGVLLLTLHGSLYVHLFAPETLEEFETIGHIEIESGADGANESASFHQEWAVRALFREFEMIGHFPAGRIQGRRIPSPLAAFQDVYVLRRAD
jgi:SAM-dependent methyltransferase